MIKRNTSKGGLLTSNGTIVMRHRFPFSLRFVHLLLSGFLVSTTETVSNQIMVADKDNILVVHCNAGKGRTGTAICAILLYLGIFNNVDDCLRFFGFQRFTCSKGVT